MLHQKDLQDLFFKKTDFYPVSPNPLLLGSLYTTEMMRSEETFSAQMLINSGSEEKAEMNNPGSVPPASHTELQTWFL